MEEERKNNQTEAAISVEAGATTRDTGASRGARRIVHTSSSPAPVETRLASDDYLPGRGVYRRKRSCKLSKILYFS